MPAAVVATPVKQSSGAHPRYLFWLLALLVLAWSGNYIAVKVAIAGLAKAGAPDPGVAAVGTRVIISALTFLALPPFLGEFGRVQRLNRRELTYMLLLAASGITGNQYFFVTGVGKTSVAHSSLVIALIPIFVLLMAAVAGQERITTLKIAGIAIAFAGLIELLHTARGGSATLGGDLTVLGATVTFSFYTVLSKSAVGRFSTFTLNYYVYVLGALLTLPLLWRALYQTPWKLVGPAAWAGVLYLALLGSVVAYLIYYAAMKSMSASQVATLTYLQPVIASLLGAALLPGEALTASLVLGGTIILIGVYLVEKN
jgi:drug/metabolite transporter (DMT)-like permease